MNPYALSGTAPSRRRVYLFHHLGDPLHITGFGRLCNKRRESALGSYLVRAGNLDARVVLSEEPIDLRPFHRLVLKQRFG